jgi:hypothetical protein
MTYPENLTLRGVGGGTDVAGKTWATYRASPLHSFDEARLADYATSLRDHMTADCQRAVGPHWCFLSAAHRILDLPARMLPPTRLRATLPFLRFLAFLNVLPP